MAETSISLVVVCLATGFGLACVARDPANIQRLLIAGLTVSAGVVVMHYLGLYGACASRRYINWSGMLVGMSLVIAPVAATAALLPAFSTRQIVLRLIAAFIMAIAVCAMHYTGMAAADYVCTAPDRFAAPTGSGLVVSQSLTDLVRIVAGGIGLVLSLDLISQKLLSSNKKVS